MAREIWGTLRAKGEMSVAALKKSLGAKEATADWAIGWLAREDKILLRKERHTVKIAPRPVQSPVQDSARMDMYRQAATDLNYKAFLAEAAKLDAEYPGYLVAYCDGARVAMGRSAQELLEKLPTEYRDRTLFVKDVPERIMKFRRPLRILER